MFRFVYITAPNKEEAKRIGRILVEERLSACVNIYPEIESIYWWEGKMVSEREAVVIAKTTDSLIPKLIERVKEVHPYECPCIVSFEIGKAYEPFLKWISEEVRA